MIKNKYNIYKLIKKITVLVSIMYICAVIGVCIQYVKAADIHYNVEFRAGAHGTINGKSQIKIESEYQENLTAIPEPDYIEKGYWFTGYSPEIADTVTENAVYVAQYARLIDAVEYRVNYIDEYGKSVATQKIAYANNGELINAYAVDIKGYQADATQKSQIAKQSDTEITFIYSLGSKQDNSVIRNSEDGIVTDTILQVQQNQQTGFNAGRIENTGAIENAGIAENTGVVGDVAIAENTGAVRNTETSENTDENIIAKEDERLLENQDLEKQQKLEEEDATLANNDISNKSKIPVLGYIAGGAVLGIAAMTGIIMYGRARILKNK